MRFQLNFGTSHPLPPFLEGGGKSAPPRGFKEPKKAGSNRVKINLVDIPALRGLFLTAAHSGPHHLLGSPAKADVNWEI